MRIKPIFYGIGCVISAFLLDYFFLSPIGKDIKNLGKIGFAGTAVKDSGSTRGMFTTTPGLDDLASSQGTIAVNSSSSKQDSLDSHFMSKQGFQYHYRTELDSSWVEEWRLDFSFNPPKGDRYSFRVAESPFSGMQYTLFVGALNNSLRPDVMVDITSTDLYGNPNQVKIEDRENHTKLIIGKDSDGRLISSPKFPEEIILPIFIEYSKLYKNFIVDHTINPDSMGWYEFDKPEYEDPQQGDSTDEKWIKIRRQNFFGKEYIFSVKWDMSAGEEELVINTYNNYNRPDSTVSISDTNHDGEPDNVFFTNLLTGEVYSIIRGANCDMTVLATSDSLITREKAIARFIEFIEYSQFYKEFRIVHGIEDRLQEYVYRIQIPLTGQVLSLAN